MDTTTLIQEVYSLINDKEYQYVDVMPIIERHSENLDHQKQKDFRLNFGELLGQMSNNGTIEFYSDDQFKIYQNRQDEFTDDSIKIKGSQKYYEDKRRDTLQKEANRNKLEINGNIIGHVFQDSSLVGDFNAPIAIPPNTATNNSEKKQTLLKQMWSFISDNKLIAGILTAIILYGLGHSFHVKF